MKSQRRGSARLTDKFVQGVKPPERDKVDYFDATVSGLGLRVSYGGGKSWIVMYRSPVERDARGHGKLRRMTLGKYPAISLADARDKAGAILRRVERGEDPQREKMQARVIPKTLDDDPVSVADGVGRYVEDHVKVKNKPQVKADGSEVWAREKIFDNHVIPHVGDMDLSTFMRKDAMSLHRIVTKEAGSVAADRAVEALRAAFNWLSDKELADVRIFRFKTDRPKDQASRHRVLSTDEIKALWLAIKDDDGMFASIVKLLLLTGQRRSEVSGMKWEELDLEGGRWNLPPERTKNKLPHVVPISASTKDIIKGQSRHAGCDYVFTSNGRSSFTGFSACKMRLDERLTIPHWTLHDLRRTFVTKLNDDLGIPPHIVEACVNHVTGAAKVGVAGVYNKAQYMAERETALDRWANWIATLTNDEEGNVVPFGGQADA